MSPDHSVRLRTANLVLRPTLPGDVERAIEIRSDPAVARNLASATIPPDTRKMTEWFAGHAREWHEGTAYRFAITRDDRLIGVCDIFDVSDGEGEIGYWLDRAVWRRGFGLEAARCLVEFGFNEIGLRALIAGCADDNAGSAAILEKLGFDRLANATIYSTSRQEDITQRRFRLLSWR
jgi:ribosomal-protein-alanine N-acetyltransferase